MEINLKRRKAKLETLVTYYRRALTMIVEVTPAPVHLANDKEEFLSELCRTLVAKVEIAHTALRGESLTRPKVERQITAADLGISPLNQGAET